MEEIINSSKEDRNNEEVSLNNSSNIGNGKKNQLELDNMN